MKISKGYPQYFRSVVHSIIGVCPNENIGGLSIVFLECCPKFFCSMSNETIIGLSTVFSKCVQ